MRILQSLCSIVLHVHAAIVVSGCIDRSSTEAFVVVNSLPLFHLVLGSGKVVGCIVNHLLCRSLWCLLILLCGVLCTFNIMIGKL